MSSSTNDSNDKTTITLDMEEHFHSFVENHPQATYEEWIGDLHPNAKEECLLEGLGGEILIDSEYYEAENGHRQLWNKNLAGKRVEVPATVSNAEPLADGEESSANLMITDLLGTSQLTPPGSPANKEGSNFPLEKDLMSFD